MSISMWINKVHYNLNTFIDLEFSNCTILTTNFVLKFLEKVKILKSSAVR